MARLTQAWDKCDEAEFDALEAEVLDPDDESLDLGDRIDALTKTRDALEVRIKSLEDELQETLYSDWELLRQRTELVAKEGGDLLADLASELSTRVDTLKMELRLRDGTETSPTANNMQDCIRPHPRVVDARPGSAGQACSLGLCEHPHHLHKTPT